MGGFDEIVSIKISRRPNVCTLKNDIDERHRVTGVCIDYLSLHNGFLGKGVARKESKRKCE